MMTSYHYKYHVALSRYKAFPQAKFVYYPFVQVGLVKDGKAIKTPALIDTGAQYCFFDNSYAKVLKIDYKDTPHQCYLTGIGGQSQENKAYFHDIKLVIYKPGSLFGLSQKAWEIETKVGFLEKPALYSAILGEYGFFDNFKFTCCLPESYFEIEYAHD